MFTSVTLWYLFSYEEKIVFKALELLIVFVEKFVLTELNMVMGIRWKKHLKHEGCVFKQNNKIFKP